MSIFAILLFPIFLLPIGIILIATGRRGILLDDHPVCRRCRFDLFGLPTSSTRCSECGADLTLPKAILNGNCRRRPGMVMTGWFLVLLFTLALGLLSKIIVTNIEWSHLLPTPWLVHQAKSPASTTHDPALAELRRRIAAGELSDARITELTDHTLSLQSDRSSPWIPAWGDLLESAHAAGKLPADKWTKYLTAAPDFRLATRASIRRGDPLPTSILLRSARVGALGSIWVRSTLTIEPDSDLLRSPQPFEGGFHGNAIGPGTNGSFEYSLTPTLTPSTPDGPKTLHLKLHAKLNSQYGSSDSPTDVSADYDLRAPWTLLPASAAAITPITDPSQRTAIEKSITVNRLLPPSTGERYANLTLTINNPPVPLAFRIFLRSGDQEYPIGRLAVLAGAMTSSGTGFQFNGPPAKQVDLIFRPDPAIAADTTDLTQYWDGQITIKNVTVPTEPPNPGAAY